MIGTFRLLHGKSSSLISSSTVPINIRASGQELSSALVMIPYIWNATAINTLWDESTMEWVVEFNQDVDDIGTFNLDVTNVHSKDGNLSISAEIDTLSGPLKPDNYGYGYLFDNTQTCGSTYIGESSAL
eukprot:7045069-Ditylum_brightwellii.AAC.1